MTGDELAILHAAAFEAKERAWSAEEFSALLSQPYVDILTSEGAFLLFQHIGDEAEIITLAVDPKCQRKGLGRNLLKSLEARAQLQTIFLEVAEDNAPALHLYRSFGFKEEGRRKAYYHYADGRVVDALIMRKSKL